MPDEQCQERATPDEQCRERATLDEQCWERAVRRRYTTSSTFGTHIESEISQAALQLLLACLLH